MRNFVLGAFLAISVLWIGGWRGVKALLSPPEQASPVESYSARTDFAVVPLPDQVPNMGGAEGAGNSATDPDFKTQIYRLTDINTIPHARYPTQQDWHMNCGGWGAWHVSNLDTTKLFICQNGGGALLLPFDPSSGKAGRARELPAGVSGYPEWSKTENNVAFGLAPGGNLEIVKLDFSSPGGKVTSVVDLTKTPNCAQELSGKAMWRELSFSWDDTTFALAASTGIQDTAHFVYVWNAKTGCQVYDTQAGTIDGSEVVGSTDRFPIHSIMISGNGKVVVISPSGGDIWRHFWHVGTHEVDALQSDLDYGHFALGYDSFLNSAGHSSNGKWCKLGMAIRPVSALRSPNYVLTSEQCANTLTQGDNHISWENDDQTDKKPFSTSAITGPLGAPITAPWQNEILVFTQDGAVHREAHTFNSGKSKFFACQNAIGSISQDGKWFFFSSDWEMTLGKDSAGNFRCDDFAVELH